MSSYLGLQEKLAVKHGIFVYIECSEAYGDIMTLYMTFVLKLINA